MFLAKQKMNQRQFATILLIIIVIILIISIIHLLKIRSTEGNGGRVTVHGTYIVTKELKTESNPNYGHGSKYCFYINGLEAPKLVLQRGFYYEFKNESDEPLYFSTNPIGGKGAPNSLAKNKKKDFIGLSNGIIFFLITPDLPDEFYYQSGENSSMGGKIQVI